MNDGTIQQTVSVLGSRNSQLCRGYQNQINQSIIVIIFSKHRSYRNKYKQAEAYYFHKSLPADKFYSRGFDYTLAFMVALACICHPIFSTTTHYFFSKKILCCAHGAQHNIFRKK